MYKVYINERALIFNPFKDSVNGADLVFKLTGDEEPEKLRIIVEAFERNNLIPTMLFQSADIDKTWKTFTNFYKIIEAAGGVVVNEENCLLMIFRNGKWDLPKGKIEKGEEPDVAAIREVEEECGIGEMKLQKQLATTFHTYPFKSDDVLKKTYWFLMRSSDHTIPIPQLEEGITAVKWMTKSEVLRVMPQAYASITALIKEHVLDDSPSLLG